MTVNVAEPFVAGALVTSICSLPIRITSPVETGSAVLEPDQSTGMLVVVAEIPELAFTATAGLYATGAFPDWQLPPMLLPQLLPLQAPMQMPP